MGNFDGAQTHAWQASTNYRSDALTTPITVKLEIGATVTKKLIKSKLKFLE